MKLTINGVETPAQVIDENGTPTGHAPVYQILQAYGIPVRIGPSGELLAGVRRFAEAMGRPHSYDEADHRFLIDAAPPVPDIPVEPVGAGINPWIPVTPVITSGPGDRRPELYQAVLQQFQVARNPRYTPRDTSGDGEIDTHCDAYVSDCTKAMGCEIPPWAYEDRSPSPPGEGGELSANGSILWLRAGGTDGGWRKLKGATEALERAIKGYPVAACYYNSGGIGHVAMVRPGQPDPIRGIPVAQAGARNFDDGFLLDGFGSYGPIEFWTHD